MNVLLHQLLAGDFPDMKVEKELFEHDSKIEEARRAVRDFIQFRLAGYHQSGKRMYCERDAIEDLQRGVQDVEAPLVVDPVDIEKELRLAPSALAQVGGDYNQLSSKDFPFVRKGGHAFLTPMDKLQHVRSHGTIILVEIVAPGTGEVIPLGYCHALDTIPHASRGWERQQFPGLHVSTLQPDGDTANLIKADPAKVMAIWRTGIRETLDAETLQKLGIELGSGIGQSRNELLSLRRLGIGSALKYIILRQAALRRKMRATLNIGEVRIPGVNLPNAASMAYNMRFLNHWGMREHVDKIVVPAERAGEEREVARMAWHSFGNTIPEALGRLEGGDGVLETKGWDISKLRSHASRIREKVERERDTGEHA